MGVPLRVMASRKRMATSESTERRYFVMQSSYTACFSKTPKAAVLENKLFPSQSSTYDDVKG